MSQNNMIIFPALKNSQGITKVIIDGKLRCSCCGYNLDISNFFKDKSSASGYKSYCKRCANRWKDKKKKEEKNTIGIIGIYLETCAYCKKQFATKTKTKAYCSPKCRKRDWYEKNEQHRWRTSYKKEILG